MDVGPGAGGGSDQDHWGFRRGAVHFDLTADLTVPLSRLIVFRRPIPLVHIY